VTARSIEGRFGLVLLALVIHSSYVGNAAVQTAGASLPPPANLTAEQDHQRLMDLLHITSLRRGADGDPKSPNAANYDESKANPYPKLPDPLLLNDGKKVTTATMWWDKRRPEIVEDFDREVYGREPKNTPKVNWELVSTKREVNGEVPVVTRKLIGHVETSAYPLVTVDIDLTVTTPANAKGPVPVMMEFSWSPEVMAALAKRFPEMSASAPGPTWQQQVLAKGWGYAIYIPTSVQADNGAGLTQGIIGLVNRGQPRKLDDWGALRAWAWGASRALDYFETDKLVDAKQVGIEGHSRYGKAALVAMAYDPRFAIAYISSSGEGGAKLFRHNFGEQIGNVAGTGEYHWMAGNFLKYAGPLTENDLPVDAHELIALCAPRPVYVGAGATNGDGWADAKGMFLAAAGAGPVYRLLGKKDLGATEFPPIESALIGGEIAFRQHSAGHTPAPNWPTFLNFASRYMKEQGAPVPAPPKPSVSKTRERGGPTPASLARVSRRWRTIQSANGPDTRFSNTARSGSLPVQVVSARRANCAILARGDPGRLVTQNRLVERRTTWRTVNSAFSAWFRFWRCAFSFGSWQSGMRRGTLSGTPGQHWSWWASASLPSPVINSASPFRSERRLTHS